MREVAGRDARLGGRPRSRIFASGGPWPVARFNLHRLIRCVLDFGVGCEMVARNVAFLIVEEDLPKAQEPEPNALGERRTARLLQEAREPTHRAKKRGAPSSEPSFYFAVAFSVYPGSRRGEVLAVRWSDLNLRAMYVTIRRWLAETKTRGLFFKTSKNGNTSTSTGILHLSSVA